jgi:hypothetical protein
MYDQADLYDAGIGFWNLGFETYPDAHDVGRSTEERAMKRLFVALTALILTLSVAVQASATHSWSDYHWARSSNPFTVTLIDNVTSDWDSRLAIASADWSASSVLDTEIAAAGRREVTVSNGFYGQTGWVGLARIWIDGRTHHILRGETLLNETYLTDDQRYATEAFRQFVICQEVGHTFGLDHQDEVFSNQNLGTCMDYTNDPDGGKRYGPDNQHPNAHDYEQLELIYAHADKGKKGHGNLADAEVVTWIIPA